MGKQSDCYLVRQIPCDFGEAAWEVEKLDAKLQTVESYAVHFAGNESSCTCRGCTEHRHCKHLYGLQKLDELNDLPRLLHRQKMVACPRCQDVSPDGAPGLCPGCTAEDTLAGYDQACEMEAGGCYDGPPLDGDSA